VGVGLEADIVASTAPAATRRLGSLDARPAAHSRKADSTAASVASIVSSALTSASRRKRGTTNLDITLIEPGLRRRIARARVAHFATSDGIRPSVVPVCFVLLDETIYQAIDAKPKSVAPGRLRRVRNVRTNARAALLIDEYFENWRRLWWVLLHGRARIVDRGPERQRALAALRRKYPQYRTTTPLSPTALVIALDVRRLRQWSASSLDRRGARHRNRPA
jgi:PPOX class probable F420-dependent enzyme